MKIGLITSSAWQLPSPARTGDIVVLDLAKALDDLGHEVHMFAPKGTQFHTVHEMTCAYGTGTPSPMGCESLTYDKHVNLLPSFEILHDFSTCKWISHLQNRRGSKVIQTIFGGPWRQDYAPTNLYACSSSQADRVGRGATDYENTATPDIGGPNGTPVSVNGYVYLGCDTSFYIPGIKSDYYLWLNRWHPVKGYKEAITFAKDTGHRTIIAGVHPDDETEPYQKNCALEAIELAKGIDNIELYFLPKDETHNEVKRQLYQGAIALLYPTQFQEPFGLSQIEAMACGTRVMHSELGSCPEIKGIQERHKLTPRATAERFFDIKVMAKNYLKEYYKALK